MGLSKQESLERNSLLAETKSNAGMTQRQQSCSPSAAVYQPPLDQPTSAEIPVGGSDHELLRKGGESAAAGGVVLSPFDSAPSDNQSGEENLRNSRKMSRQTMGEQLGQHLGWEQMSVLLFGPFYSLAKPFFPNDLARRGRAARKLFFYAVIVLLIARAIAYFGMLGRVALLTANWARASIQFSITLNALGALFWLRKGSSDRIGGFPREFANALIRAFGQNYQPKCSLQSLVGSAVAASFFMFASLVWALQRVLRLQFGETIKSSSPNNNGSSASTLNETAGETVDAAFVVVDALIALLAGLIGALVLGLFQLAFKSVQAELTAFKKEQFDPLLENGRIFQSETLAQLSSAISPLLRLAHSTGSQMENLGMGLFMTAIFCNLSASFITSGGGGVATEVPSTWMFLNILDKTNNTCWAILCIILLISSLKYPYDLHATLREMREQILLEEHIWKDNDRERISLANSIVRRLSGVRIHRIGSQLFNLALIAQIVLIYLLVSTSNCTPPPKAM